MAAVNADLQQLRLLTADEVAEILRVGRATVYRWAEQGWLPAIRVGGTVRFNLADVQQALQAHPQRMRVFERK